MKTTTAFRALAANRLAAKKFAVVSVTKAGVPSKIAPSEHCRSTTREGAEIILDRVSKLNPASRFTIIEL